MRNVTLLPRGADLVAAVARTIAREGRDYADTIVVFPGKRPAHFLRRLLAAAAGGPFAPPRIFSIDEFVDYVYEERAGCADGKLSDIDAVALLYEMHRSMTGGRIGGENFAAPDRFFPIGAKLFRDMEELRIEDVKRVDIAQIEAYVEDGVPEQSAAVLRSLSGLYGRFYAALAERGRSTRSTRYAKAADVMGGVVFPGCSRLVFAGFFALTKAERRIFAALGERRDTAFIFQRGAGIDGLLGELGVAVGDDDANQEADSAQAIHFYRSPDAHGQVFALRDALAALSEPFDERTVVVLPDANALFPVMHHALAGMDDGSYNISLGYPFAGTPVYGFIETLMQLVSSMDGDLVYIPDYLRFALHPFVKNLRCSGEPATTRILMHVVEERLTAKSARTFVLLEDIESDAELFVEASDRIGKDGGFRPTAAELAGHLREVHGIFIRDLRQFGSVAEFARKFAAVTAYLRTRSDASRHRFFTPFAGEFETAMEALGRSLMADVVFENIAGYFGFLKSYAAGISRHFPGTPLQGLQVLGSLETRNIGFRRVFVLDANEGVLPAGGKHDSFIPFTARKALGLPVYTDRDRIAAYYFDTLVSSADEAHFFYVENSSREKSRFVEQLLWRRQQADGALKPDAYVRKIEYRIALKNTIPPPVAKTSAVMAALAEFAFSATALNTYLDCPIRFYYTHVLKLREQAQVTGEVERKDIGDFVHAVLHEFFTPFAGRPSPLAPADLDGNAMKRLVAARFPAFFGDDAGGRAYLLGKQLASRLADFLEKYQKPLCEQNVRIVSLEEPYEATFTLADGRTVRFHGKIDRVETRVVDNVERTCILDYKTTANEKALAIRFDKFDAGDRTTWRRRIGSLQLPFYHILYASPRSIPDEAVRCGFVILGKKNIDSRSEIMLAGTDSEVIERMATMRRLFGLLLAEVLDTAVPFNAPEKPKESCPDCEFAALCGTGWLKK